MGVRVRLELFEVLLAAEVGIKRHISARKNGRADAHNCSRDDRWRMDIEGACGEMAVAKYFERYWSGSIGRVDTGDVGDFEVRTRPRSDSDLILYRKDKDDSRYFLVTGNAPDFEIVGWIYARDGKRDEWWREPPRCRSAAYFVPQSALHPLERKDS
jgi:hypothetical protein